MPDEFRIAYEAPEDRPFLPVTGAFGGPVPDGSGVMVHLYAEYATTPTAEIHPIQNGDVSEKYTHLRDSVVTRKIFASLLLAPETANKIGAWLQKNAGVAESIREAQEEGPE